MGKSNLKFPVDGRKDLETLTATYNVRECPCCGNPKHKTYLAAKSLFGMFWMRILRHHFYNESSLGIPIIIEICSFSCLRKYVEENQSAILLSLAYISELYNEY